VSSADNYLAARGEDSVSFMTESQEKSISTSIFSGESQFDWPTVFSALAYIQPVTSRTPRVILLFKLSAH